MKGLCHSTDRLRVSPGRGRGGRARGSQIVGPAREVGGLVGAEPVVHDLAFQLREYLYDEAQVVVHFDVAVVLQGVEQDALVVLGHDGLPEGAC